MINVLIPITNNPKGFRKIIASLSNADDVTLFIGVTSSLASELRFIEGDNVYLFEYQDGSNREEIINAMQKYIGNGSLFIMRKPITENQFNRFVNSDKDVVVCKRDFSPIKNFFFDLWQKILRLCLGVRMYDGDTSAIYFNDDIATVVAQTNNLSFSSRANRWRGLEQATVEVDGGAVKTEVDKRANIKYFIIMAVAALIAVAVTTCVSIFASVNVIVGLLLFCLCTISLSIILILLVMVIFNCMVGKRAFQSAVEVEYDENELETNDEQNYQAEPDDESNNVDFE